MALYRARYQDPEGRRSNGFPTYAWHAVPAGLCTRRQLAAERLRPVGDPVAQLKFPRYGRVVTAYLYEARAAVPKLPMTEGRWRTVQAMLRARSTCTDCGTIAPYCLPTRWGQICLDCAAAAGLTT